MPIPLTKSVKTIKLTGMTNITKIILKEMFYTFERTKKRFSLCYSCVLVLIIDKIVYSQLHYSKI